MLTEWVDLALLCTLVLSVLVGIWRGLLFEFLSIAGWLVGYFAAPHLAPHLARWLPEEKMSAGVLHVASLVLAFMLILLLWGLGARLLRTLIHASPLSIFDRLAGGGFGALRGLLLSLMLVVLVSMTPLRNAKPWADSTFVPWLQRLLQSVRPFLPEEVLELIPAQASSSGLV